MASTPSAKTSGKQQSQPQKSGDMKPSLHSGEMKPSLRFALLREAVLEAQKAPAPPATRGKDYADPQAVTEQEELEDGQYRLLKARRQSEALAARTQGLSPSQRDTQPPTE